MLVYSLGSTGGKVIGSDEGIKMGSTDGKVLGTIIGNVDGITVGLDLGTDLVFLDGSFDDSNYGKLAVLFFVGSLGSTVDKVFSSNEGIKIVPTDGKVLGTILGHIDGMTVGIDVRTD